MADDASTAARATAAPAGDQQPPPPQQQQAVGAVAAAAESALDLELLQLCFDEAEFGSHLGALLSKPSSGALSDENQKDNEDDEDEDNSMAAGFNPQEFVAGKLEHVSPDVLERDLKTYAKHLEAAVLKCVHEEVHEAFVDVSGELVSMEGTITQVQRPLAEMESRLDRVRSTLEAVRTAARGDIAAAVKHEVARMFYAAVLEASLLHNNILRASDAIKVRLDSVESADKHGTSSQGASPVQSPTSSSPPAPCADSGTLADIASELGVLAASVVRLKQLVVHVKKAAPGNADDQASADEITSLAGADAEAVLELCYKHFTACFKRYADSPSTEAGTLLSTSVNLFRQLHEEAAFAAFLKTSVVRPVVEEVITWRAASSAKSSVDATAKMFNELIARLRSTVLVALPLIQQRLGKGTYLLASSVWPAVGDTIMKRLVYFFTPGIPSTFHKSFTVAADLVAALESVATSAEELAALRSSPDMTLWRSKWNLDVYHQLRKDEIDQMVKSKNVLVPPFASASDCAPFSIPQFKAAAGIVEWILDPNTVFIYAAQKLLLRDACDVLVQLMDAAKSECASAGPLTVIEIMRNCGALAKYIDVTISGKVAQALAGDAAAAAPITAFMRKLVLSGVQGTRGALVQGLVKRSMANLGHVSSVKRIFSSSGPMPTQPSAYLTDALADVASFRAEATKSQALAESECKDVVHEVLREATTGLHDAVKAVLASAKKQQDSLDKLGRGKHSKLSEKPREKIVMQLYLDIHEYGDMLRKFGLNKEVYAPFKDLLGLVDARARWILADCEGPEPAAGEASS